MCAYLCVKPNGDTNQCTKQFTPIGFGSDKQVNKYKHLLIHFIKKGKNRPGAFRTVELIALAVKAFVGSKCEGEKV